MKEEIKEILEYMKQKQYISETNINYGYKTLSAGQVELLLDYITNLQEIIDKAIELTENLLKTEDKGYYQILFKKQLEVLQGEDTKESEAN